MLTALFLAGIYITGAKVVKHVIRDGQENGWVRW